MHREFLNQDSELLPPPVHAIGVDVVDDALVGWCAPSVGRIATIRLSWGGFEGAREFSRWLCEDHGFNPERSVVAAEWLLERIHRGVRLTASQTRAAPGGA